MIQVNNQKKQKETILMANNHKTAVVHKIRLKILRTKIHLNHRLRIRQKIVLKSLIYLQMQHLTQQKMKQ